MGKPVTQADLSNTGWVDPVQLGNWVNQAYTKYTWYGGVMFWQYQSDVAGNAIQSAAGSLVSQCTINKNCL